MAKALSVSDYIISRAESENKPVSNLMLQKIMYFLNVIHLLNNNTPLIDDDNFEKWAYGPVIHEVYTEYSSNGAQPIKEPKKHIKGFKVVNNKIIYTFFNDKEYELENSDKEFINNNIDKLINFNPFDLVEYSHKEPQWNDKTINNYNNEETKKYFSKKDNQFWIKDNG